MAHAARLLLWTLPASDNTLRTRFKEFLVALPQHTDIYTYRTSATRRHELSGCGQLYTAHSTATSSLSTRADTNTPTTTACTNTAHYRDTESQVTYVHASFLKGTNAAYASNNRSSGSRGAYDGPPRPPPATIAEGLQRILTKHSVQCIPSLHSNTVIQPLVKRYSNVLSSVVQPLTPADPAAGHWAQVVATAKGTADTEPSSAPASSTPTTSTGVTSSSQRLTLAEAEAALSAALTSSSGALSADRAHERFLSNCVIRNYGVNGMDCLRCTRAGCSCSKEPFGTVPQLDSLSSPPGNGAQWHITSNGSDNGSSLPSNSPPPQQLRPPQQQQQQQQRQQQRDYSAMSMSAAAAGATAASTMRSSSSLTGGNNCLTNTITNTSSSTANNSVVSRARLAAGRTDEQCKQLNLYCGASRTANLLRRSSDLNLGANSCSKAHSKAALIGYKRGSSSTATVTAAQNDSSDELQQQQQELHLNTAVPFSAVVLGAEGSGCAHTVQVLMQAFVNTSSTLHTAHSSSSSSSAAAAAAVQDVSSIKGKASVLVLHYGGTGGGSGVSPDAKIATDSMAQQQQAAPDNGLPSGSQFAPVTVLVPPTAYNSAIRRYAQHLSTSGSSFRVAPLQIRWSDVDVFVLRTLLFAVPPRGDESLTHTPGQTPANLHSSFGASAFGPMCTAALMSVLREVEQEGGVHAAQQQQQQATSSFVQFRVRCMNRLHEYTQ
eukprot:10291-Heterococcus_DN1.PRE.1